jgi:hypothetical protein
VSTPAAARAGHQAAATATAVPTRMVAGTTSGWTASDAVGAWSACEMPADIGPAAARPAAAPTTAPIPPRIAASPITNHLTCRAVAPSTRASDSDRRRSVTFISIALPTMNQAMAIVRPVTKSSPRSAECMTSSAMPARPAGTSASSPDGSRPAVAASTFGRDASARRTTRTRSTSPSPDDISSSAPISTITPAPSANHLVDRLSAMPTTVSRRTPRRAKKMTSSPIPLPSAFASAASSTTSSAPPHARPAAIVSSPAAASDSASTPTAISRTRRSPTRRSVGR